MTDHEILLTGKGALPFRFPSPIAHEQQLMLEVPRTLHMIWIGDGIPAKYMANVEDFARHNPYWHVMLWDDLDARGVVDAQMRNRDLFDIETNVAAKVDLLRYELVHKYGGVYLDADTRSLGPGSLDRMTHAFLTVSHGYSNTGNAQFGFARGSEFLAYVIEHARDPRVRAMAEIPERTGPTFLTTCALSFGDMRIVHPDGAWLLEKVHHCADKNW